MATRKDGRIEAGQRLSRAISARAWNRAQDAADIVLGSRPSLAAGDFREFPGALVVPCRIAATGLTVKPGHVVNITGKHAAWAPQSGETESPHVTALSGSIISPVLLSQVPSTAVRLGVIVGGVAMPKSSGAQIVRVCIAGMCVARVRNRGVGNYLNIPVIRSSGDTTSNLAGCAETSTCGTHRWIQFLTSIDAERGISYAVVVL